MRDKITISRVAQLHPKARPVFLAFIDDIEKEFNVTVRMVQGLRTFKEQQDIYNQGRTKPGKKVTNAKPGESYHNYGFAGDLVVMENGKPNWNFDYNKFRPLYKKHGLTWGNDWDNDGVTKAEGDKDEKLVDAPHYQITFGIHWKDMLAKYKAKDFIKGTDYINI